MALLICQLGQPILTVTDADGGLGHGSVINFVPVGGEVRFEVSLGAAERNGLELSAPLLSMALRVTTGEP